MNNNEEIIALAAQIEAAGGGETVDLPVGTQREEATAWMRDHSGRLWDQITDDRRLTPRAVIRCPEGDRLFDVFDVPGVGPVIAKGAITRGYEHAEQEAQDRRTSRAWAAPVDVLIAASDGPVPGLAVCERHIEANLSPSLLRWLTRQEGNIPVPLQHKGIDARRAPGLTGGEITIYTEGIADPPD